jgi:hypothetical protein
MAQTYGSDTRIIFDLWNEPVHDSSDWADTTYWTELKPSYESLIQTVRNNGAQNIVLATGSGWASWLGGIKDSPLADANVVYAYHKYSVEGSNTADQWNQDTGGLIGVKPVIVSEWGYEDNDVANPTWPGSQASYGDAFTQWMESNNLSNLAWMYHHDWTPRLLKLDGSLTLYGTFVKNYIVQNNNLPDPQPTVTSIVRAASNPVNAANVDFTVTFSETVTDVDTADFSLTTTGVAGAAVSGVSGSGSVYTITVTTGTGSGTIRLDLPISATINDSALNSLGSLPFTSGASYTIDKTAPQVTSIRSIVNGNINFLARFSEAVTGVDISDFSLITSGEVTGASIKNISGSGSTRTVTLNLGAGIGTIRVDVVNNGSIEDAAHNLLNAGFTTGEVLLKKNLAFTSNAANDGWTLESSEFSNIASTKSSLGTLRVGDDAKNKQYQSLLYFDTSSLPNNAVIAKVDLKITKASETGIHWDTLGNLVADMKKGVFGLAPLELTDFNAAGAPLNTAGSFSGSYQLTLNPANFKYVNLVSVTQFRLRFTKDDNNNKTADFLSFYAGEDTTNPPQLIVEYTVP